MPFARPEEPAVQAQDFDLARVQVDAAAPPAEPVRAEQLARLAEAAQTLTREPTLDGLLRTVTEAARETIGCHQAVTSRLTRGWTEASTYVSLSDKYAEWRDYDQVPKGLGVLNYVTRENLPLRLTPAQLAAHPDFRGLRDAPGHPPLPNYLAAPLVSREGRNLGLIQLSDRAAGDGEAGDFSAEDEALLVGLAVLASAAIENLELRERARAAGARVDVTARALKLLSDAGEALAETLEVDATLDTVTSLAVPLLGDWCGIHLAPEAGGGSELELAGQAAADPELGEVLGHVAEASAGAGGLDVARVLKTRRAARRAELPAPMLAAAQAALPGRDLGQGSCLVVPLAAHGRPIGTLTLVRVPGPPYTDGEVDLARELARRAALAVDNARRYAAERDTAVLLQRSMLPDLKPRARGLQIAARYLPGASGVHVGGDWYDLIDLGDDRHGLVVGDVAGRGIPAAAVMGQLRAVVRAYALEGHGPAELLGQLDRFVASQRSTPFVTCLYAIVDESRRTLTVASAGHLPPLVVDDAGAQLLAVPPGPPLGTVFGPYTDTNFTLEPGATVLLYTDGLVETRDEPITHGLERLRSAARHWRRSPEALCDGVLGQLGRLGDQEDDTALLAVSLTGREPELPPAAPRDSVEVPAEPASAAAARRWIEAALGQTGAPELVPAAALLTTELVANGIRHGGGRWLEVALVVSEAAIRVEVSDTGAGGPRPQPPPEPEVGNGRGLMIVEALAARWGYEPGPDRGKRVWFELDR